MELSDVRRHHLSLVFEQLLRNGPRSRAALAQETGLTKATISSLVADLLERELVDELDTPTDGRIGRPATDIGAAGHRIGGIGLQIAVHEVAACIVDLTGAMRIVHRHTAPNRDVPAADVLDRLRQVTTMARDDAGAQGIHCVGGTVAVPGLVDPRSGTLFVAPNLHWFDADLSSLADQLHLPPGVPVSVDNEANLSALAELRHGAGQQLSSFVHVSAGGGVGAGIVIDGQLLRGTHGFAGELGHVVVDPAGRRCACGARGCLETFVDSDADADADSAPAPAPDEVVEALAVALRSVVHLFDPEAIVLGGTLAARGDDFTTRVGQRLRDLTLGSRLHPCAVHRSQLGNDAALLGAATAALDTVLADPTTIPLRVASQHL